MSTKLITPSTGEEKQSGFYNLPDSAKGVHSLKNRSSECRWSDTRLRNTSNLMTSYSTEEPCKDMRVNANDEDQCHRPREDTIQ